ncbi:MAG: type II secretion system F family protein [Candidatus Pacebacteria bacterium]|nr:type II secretion system F family protein [Candidatus Paceibacterota bacterium]
MANFLYKARNSISEVQTGQLKAENRTELAALLKQKKLTLISAQEFKEKKEIQFFVRKKVGLVDKMLFTRNLAVMLRSGLPFSRSLAILSEQTKSKYFAEVLKGIQVDVEKGTQLADSMAKYPKVFDNLFVSMVRVGDTGGNLEEVLGTLSLQIKKDHELTGKVKGAMMYPAIVICAMVLIGVIMMIFVFPKLMGMFTESGKELPLATRSLMFVSDALVDYGLYIFGVLAIFIYFFLKSIKTPIGKKNFDSFMLKIPAIGPVLMKVNVARFCRTVSSMISSGVSIVQALDTVSGTLGNYAYSASAKDACIKVQKGLNLSEVISEYGTLYPSMMIHMIEVGEETGSVETTMKQVAEYYEEEVDQFTSNLSSVIEPILMLVMGGAVGVFAIALIQPMYSVMETV